jgi:hypothetical protein
MARAGLAETVEFDSRRGLGLLASLLTAYTHVFRSTMEENVVMTVL